MTLRRGAATFIGATSLRIVSGIGKSGLYTITLATGAASFVGAIGIGGQPPMSRLPKTRKNLLKVGI